jgi:ribosomal-protein-alanine N-acetyltransferase
MGIHPDFRRIGLGTVLLRLMMKTAAQQGARTMGLNCDAGNTRAIALYKKNGWQEAESEIKYVLKLHKTNTESAISGKRGRNE